MTTTKLRKDIKAAIDRVPAERLESVADFVEFLARPTLAKRIREAEKAFAAGKGVNWRKVRSDV